MLTDAPNKLPPSIWAGAVAEFRGLVVNGRAAPARCGSHVHVGSARAVARNATDDNGAAVVVRGDRHPQACVTDVKVVSEEFGREIKRKCTLGAGAKAMGIDEVLMAPHAPWQNAFVERFIGSARRECFDHVIVLNEAGVRKLLKLIVRTTNGLARTWRSTRTPRFLVRSRRPAMATSWRSPGRRPPPSIRAARSLNAPSRRQLVAHEPAQGRPTLPGCIAAHQPSELP